MRFARGLFMTTFDRLMEPVLPILKEIEQGRVPHFNETLPWPLFVQVPSPDGSHDPTYAPLAD